MRAAMRWLLVALALTACGTPRRPPVVAPARVELETLLRKHFSAGEATPAEQARLAVLLDLHGRGAEAALLETADDPARAERAWFAGAPDAPFCDVREARARLPGVEARLAHDPRAIRTLWLLGRAAGLDPAWQAAIADRWRRDWPESTEARRAQAINRADQAPEPPPVDLAAWSAAHPVDRDALDAAFAQWTPPPGAEAPGLLAWRVLAVWDGAAFEIREERVPFEGPTRIVQRRAAIVPTATDHGVFRLIVQVWGAPMTAEAGAVSPILADGRYTARFDGVPKRRPDAWAPSPGPHWAHAEARPEPVQRAALHWRLWPRGAGWHGTLEGDGVAPAFDALLAWLPGLSVASVQALPGGGWRAQVAFAAAPRRSLLDDRAVDLLGGPVSMARLADAAPRRENLSLAPARVTIAVTRMDAPPGVASPALPRPKSWGQTVAAEDGRTVRRRWARPAVDWTAARFVEHQGVPRALVAALDTPSLRRHSAAALLFPREE